MVNAIETGIVKTPGVVGGRARVANSRITVWGLVRSRQLGLTDADILDSIPTLTPEGLATAMAYAERHVEEIGADIQENDDEQLK